MPERARRLFSDRFVHNLFIPAGRMKGFVFFLVAFSVGVITGLSLAAVIYAMTDNGDLASAIGTGGWLLCMFLMLTYGPFWVSKPQDFAIPKGSTSTAQRWRAVRAESKLQAAEIRVGIIFAIICGATAANADGSILSIVVAAICGAVLGGLVGFDVKRRVSKIREELAVEQERKNG